MVIGQDYEVGEEERQTTRRKRTKTRLSSVSCREPSISATSAPTSTICVDVNLIQLSDVQLGLETPDKLVDLQHA